MEVNLLRRKKAVAAAVRSDLDAYAAEASRASAFVGDGGTVAIDPLVNATTFEKDADKGPAGGAARSDPGLVDLDRQTANLYNVVGFRLLHRR